MHSRSRRRNIRIAVMVHGWFIAASVVPGCTDAGIATSDFDGRVGVLQEDMRIDGHALELSVIYHDGGMAVSESGLIALAEGQQAFVRLLSATGTPIGTFGHRGEGPGEFARLGSIGWHGDTLWIYDPGLSRVTFVSSELELIRTTPSLPVAVTAVHPRGDILYFDSQPNAGEQIRRIGRINADGDTRELVLAMPTTENFATSRDTQQPFANIPRHGIDPDGNRISVAMPSLSGTHSGTFRLISVSSLGDTLLDRRYKFSGERISSAVGDSVINAMVTRLAQGGMSQHAATLRAEAVIPPLWPPLANAHLKLGRDGSTWVRLRPRADDNRYYVIASDGSPIGYVDLPARSRISVVLRRDRIWVLEPDEFGVQSLVAYGVAWEEVGNAP